MGLNTWAAFVGTNEHAAVAGDVAMLTTEVAPVLEALRKNGIYVVAIHHHMDRHPAADLLSPLLGHGSGRQVGDGIQGGTGSTWDAEDHVGEALRPSMIVILRHAFTGGAERAELDRPHHEGS